MNQRMPIQVLSANPFYSSRARAVWVHCTQVGKAKNRYKAWGRGTMFWLDLMYVPGTTRGVCLRSKLSEKTFVDLNNDRLLTLYARD